MQYDQSLTTRLCGSNMKLLLVAVTWSCYLRQGLLEESEREEVRRGCGPVVVVSTKLHHEVRTRYYGHRVVTEVVVGDDGLQEQRLWQLAVNKLLQAAAQRQRQVVVTPTVVRVRLVLILCMMASYHIHIYIYVHKYGNEYINMATST